VQLDAMKNHLQQLLQKYLNEKLSITEQIELSEQLADSKNNDAEQILFDDWKSQIESGTYPEHELQSILDRVHHKIRLSENDQPFHLNGWHIFQRIAAILIFPLLFSFFAYYYFQSQQPFKNTTYAEIQCPLGVRTKFQLPDGTTGYLNSGSSLKYPVQFIGERKVDLIGEAYFDVVHNKEMPFHVNTPNLDIKVLGTTFNVIANEDETTEEIVLQTGKVNVSSKSGKQLAIVLPNEQLTLDIEKQTISKKVVEASQYSTWKDGKLVFRNENMQQVARRLSRWYNAEIVVDDRLLDVYTFHATFIDEPLDEVLKLLSLTTPLSYQEDKRAIDPEGVFQKRKIILRISQSKINQFR
jgi:transmembrane sensor